MTMSPERILCIDEEALLHPQALGLADEVLQFQPWLKIICDAQEARDYVRGVAGEIEVWVVSCNQMEGINLAAALKRDRPDAEIDLVAFSPNGSLFSRARVAGITQVMDKSSFLSRYELGKRSFAKAMARTAIDQKGRSSQLNRIQDPTVTPAVSKKIADGSKDPSPLASITQVMPSGMPLIQPQGEQTACLVDSPSQGSTMVMKKVSAAGDAFVLTIVGAGGGTGKSTIATMCACYAHMQNLRTVILDADLQFGDISYLCGVDSPLRIDDLAEAPLRLEGIKDGGSLPSVIAAPRLLERSELAAMHLPEVLSLLRQRYDVVIINTGATWSDVHVQLLETSTFTLFVLDQRPTSIRACKHALELCARCGIASRSFLFAINRCSRKALFSGSDISCAMQGARVFELQDGGRAVEERMGTGNPLALFSAKNSLAQSVSIMMDQLLPEMHGGQDFLSDSDGKKRKHGIRRKKKQ